MSFIDWHSAGPPFLTAFLAAAVECVEAASVILATGAIRGWRDVLLGMFTALLLLAILVGTLGTTIERLPLAPVQFAFATFLLLFGLRWLRKAALRSAGVIPHRDERIAFERQVRAARDIMASGDLLDAFAFAAAFQVTMLEGIEVVFVVIAVSARAADPLTAASVGAAAAFALVTLIAVAARRPLAAVPENAIKFAVGVLLCAFGCFSAGEAAGIVWPGDDWSTLALGGGFLLAAGLAVRLARKTAARHLPHHPATRVR